MEFVLIVLKITLCARFNERVGMQMEENAQITTVSIENESSLSKFGNFQCYNKLQFI